MTTTASDPTITGKPTDVAVPQRAVSRVPAISAEAYQHVGRFSGALVMACFEQIGGLERMSKWADTNPTDFYTKVFPKIMARTAQVDVSGSITIDEAISRLESGTTPTIDAEFSEVREQEYDL